MLEVLIITFAFTFGLAVKQAGLPPLVGFLAAGFALNAWGPALGLPGETGAILGHVAHLGVLLLLFTVGLKLKLSSLLQLDVIGGAFGHFTLSCLLLTPAIHLILGLDLNEALLLAIALAFSSTVLAAKVLEAKRELKSLHGRIAIGILVIQDLIALAVLSLYGDRAPSPWALVVLGLPLLRPVVYKLLDWSGHDEILVLMGMLLSLVIGGVGFEAVGLSSELGALLMGVLLAGHRRTQELSTALWSVKELFLVGFFLEIGLTGLPDGPALLFALVMGLLLPLKGALFFALLVAFKLRARNAFLASLSLACYSEFGLIVAAGVLEDWLVPLAVTVAASFVVSAPLNRFAHPLFERLEHRLGRFERAERHPEEQRVSLADARILVMGMGRTGGAAYSFLADQGASVIGLDSDPTKVAMHRRSGRNVLYADAEDSGFWAEIDLAHLEGVVLAMNDHEAKMTAARQLRRHGFSGTVIAHTMFADEIEQIIEAGADRAYFTMAEAGVGLAQHVWQAVGDGAAPAGR